MSTENNSAANNENEAVKATATETIREVVQVIEVYKENWYKNFLYVFAGVLLTISITGFAFSKYHNYLNESYKAAVEAAVNGDVQGLTNTPGYAFFSANEKFALQAIMEKREAEKAGMWSRVKDAVSSGYESTKTTVKDIYNHCKTEIVNFFSTPENPEPEVVTKPPVNS
jgi:hypothetical protein